MKNCNMTIKDDVLTITVNLKERHGTSANGKQAIVADTEGPVAAADHPTIRMDLTVYEAAPKKDGAP